MAQAAKDSSFMPYERPPERGCWETFRRGIWDGETKELFGRTAKSWGGIVLFYMIFYTCLAALFAICIQGLLYSVSDKHPTYQQEDSIIGNNPGMGFRPISDDSEQHGSLIWYVAKKEDNVKFWTSKLETFLEGYRNRTSNRIPCNYNTTEIPEDSVCDVYINKWEDCTSEKGFGYNKSSPCVLLKLNRIYNWIPDHYEYADELPEDMPEDLKEHIKKINATHKEQLNTVWVSCKGENPADEENLGPVNYVAERGFAGYYYPYINTPGYLSPLVPVQFKRPKPNVLINIECRAWAKNIHFENYKGERQGSVHLELLVD